MKPRSHHLLTWLGSVWLLLAAIILVMQFVAPIEIEVKWTTATEQEMAGFNLYRRESAGGNFIQINDHFIPGQGNALTGASYTYRDRRIVAGQKYYYRLEQVAYDNSRHMVDMGSGQVVAPQMWGMVVAGISAVTGFFLLMAGLRREDMPDF